MSFIGDYTSQINTGEIRLHLRENCQLAGGQKIWAQNNGVSAAYVNDVLLGRREPGSKILRALGYRKITRYVPTK